MGQNRRCRKRSWKVRHSQRVAEFEFLEFRQLLTVSGDFDQDGFRTADDMDLLSAEVRQNHQDTRFDLNFDGRVDAEDRRVWIEDLSYSYFGDANLDGAFGTEDMIQALELGRYENAVAQDGRWASGDWDGDGEFDSSDLIFVLQYLQYEIGPRPPQNRPPQPAAMQFVIDEDSSLVVDAAGGLVSLATDPEGDAMTAFLQLPAQNGSVAIQQNGAFIYTPARDFHGIDQFIFGLTDGHRAARGLVTISVQSVNDAPMTGMLVLQVENDRPLSVTAADGLSRVSTDVDGDSLTFELKPSRLRDRKVPSRHGLTEMDPNGAFVYTPRPLFVGTDYFLYTATDPTGAKVESRVVVTVNATNTIPVARDLTYTIDEDTVLEVDAAHGILSGAFDADGDPLQLTDFTRPSFGQWDYYTDGSFRFTPEQDFHGETSFFYAVADDDGHVSENHEGKIIVRSVFDPPIARDDEFEVAKDGRLPLAGANDPLGNDLPADAVNMRVAITQPPRHGIVVYEGNVPAAYVPDPGFSGTDSFQYQVGHETGADGLATVTLAVTTRGTIDFDASTGHLRILGTEHNDRVTLVIDYPLDDPVDVVANFDLWVDLSDALTGQIWASLSLPRLGDVRSVEFRGFAGDDSFETFHLDLWQGFSVRAFGGDGNDQLHGTGGDDWMDGGAGNDWLNGLAGNDWLFGGSGWDQLYGSLGDDHLWGGVDEDSLVGGSGSDQLFGEQGGDSLTADGPNEMEAFYGYFAELDGDDRLDGGADSDGLVSGAGHDQLEGGDGSDSYSITPLSPTQASQVDIVDRWYFDNTTFATYPNELNFGLWQSGVQIDLNETTFNVADNVTIQVSDESAIDTLLGGAGDDTLTGHRRRSNTLYGGDGNDTLTGGEFIDHIFGGFGDDVIFGGAGDDVIDGDDGNDQAYGGPGDDSVVNAIEQDTSIQIARSFAPTRFGNNYVRVQVFGGDNRDELIVTSSGTRLVFDLTKDLGMPSQSVESRSVDTTDGYVTFTFFGGKGDDRYEDRSTSVFGGIAYGGDGNDQLIGGRISSTLFGNDGNDVLVGGVGNDRLLGGDGDDRLQGAAGADQLEGGEGDDDYVFAGNDYEGDTVVERFSSEDLTIGGDRDKLDFSGYAKGISLYLPVGVEQLVGTQFDDELVGNDTHNIIDGGRGNDRILGGNEFDQLFGGDGADVLVGGAGPDRLEGGEGDDRLFADYEGSWSPFAFAHLLEGGEGNDYLFGSSGPDTINGGAGNDWASGQGGDDWIYGDAGDDRIYGGAGNDHLFGGTGIDELHGEAGQDALANESSTLLRPTLLVIVHGWQTASNAAKPQWYSDSDSVTKRLIAAFEQRGVPTKTYTVEWESTIGTNEFPTTYVANRIDGFLSTANGPWDVFLIGHSRGGVFVNKLANKIRDNVNLGEVRTIMLDPTAVLPMEDQPMGASSRSAMTKLYDDGYVLVPATLDGQRIVAGGPYSYRNVHNQLIQLMNEQPSWVQRLLGSADSAATLSKLLVSVLQVPAELASQVASSSVFVSLLRAAVTSYSSHVLFTDWYLRSADFQRDLDDAVRSKSPLDDFNEARACGPSGSACEQWLIAGGSYIAPSLDDLLAVIFSVAGTMQHYAEDLPITVIETSVVGIADLLLANAANDYQRGRIQAAKKTMQDVIAKARQLSAFEFKTVDEVIKTLRTSDWSLPSVESAITQFLP